MTPREIQLKKHTNVTRIVRLATAFGLLLAAIGLAACAKSPAPAATAEGEPAATTQPATPPTLKLVAPAAGAEVPAGAVKVAVETTGLKFTMPGNTNVAGEGHVHFTLDGGSEQMSTEPEYEFKDVSAGPHKLVAELVQNNTEKFDPPIRQELEFVAK